MDALNENIDGNKSEAAKKDSSKSKSSSTKKPSREKPLQPTNQSGKRAALVVQQLPPPMLLPPETFEKTVKAIPDKLYTSFLPATGAKKSSNDKPQHPTNQSNKRPALVVQQLPPPILLPPETFEKTVKAIPDKLYTDFLPATTTTTTTKKSDKKEKSSKKKS